MDLGRELGNNKQTFYFASPVKTRHMSDSRDNGKTTRKEKSKLFLCDYNYYNMVRCHRNVDFEEINTESSTGKNDEFWLLW